MAYIEPRKRKNGATTYYVRWQDKASGGRMHQKFDDESYAKLLLAVLPANDDDLQKAHKAVSEHYAEKYTVSRMILEHNAILTEADGYTVRRYEGYAQASNSLSQTTTAERRWAPAQA